MRKDISICYILRLFVLNIIFIPVCICNSFQDCLKMEGKSILVTGASKGIGREIAIQLSHCNVNLIATGRNVEELDELKKLMISNNEKGNFFTLSLDLKLEGNPLKLIQTAKEQFDKIHYVFFSHAIIGNYTNFSGQEKDFTLIKEMMEVNFYSAAYILSECLKYFPESKPNFVIFSSELVLEPNSMTFAYSISKSALVAFAKLLQNKEYEKKAFVTIIEVPGTDTYGLKTTVRNHYLQEGVHGEAKDFENFYRRNVKPQLQSVEVVARNIIKAALDRKRNVNLLIKKKHTEL